MFLSSAFKISLTTYLLLILAEVLQPGFVSNYFSAHWLLLIVVLLFLSLIYRGERLVFRSGVAWGLTLVVAVIACVVTWRLGAPLQELRSLMSLVAFVLPFVLKGTLEKDIDR